MIKKVFRQMLLSQIFSQIAITICMLVDSIMIGRFLGVDAMAAYGFANPVLLVFTAIGGLIAAGLQVVCSGYLGKGDQESINKVFSTTVIIEFFICIVGILAIFICLNPLTTLLGATKGTEVFGLTKEYLTGFIIGIPFFLGALLMMPFLQMSGKQNVLIIAVSALTIGDILLDFLNVKIGLFGGGIFGMGLASSISYVLAFLVGLFFFFIKKDCPYKFKAKYFKLKEFISVCRGGIPTTVNQISIVLLTLLVNNLLADLGDGGTIGVAAHSVIITIANLCYSFGTGVGAITLMLGGIFYNEEDRKGIGSIIKLGLKYSIIIDVIVVAVIFVLAGPIVNMFLNATGGGEGAETVALATIGLRIFVLSILFCCVTAVYKGYCQGTEKMRLSAIISCLQNLVFPGLFAIILSSTALGAKGIWLGYVLGEATTLLTYYVICFIKNKRVSISPEATALLPRDFGIKPEDYIEVAILDEEAAIDASIKAYDFCISHGATNKQATYFALCVEEMTMNILRFGFKKDNGNVVEMKFIHKDDSWILRIRDNCENFDPVKYFELHNDADPVAHIGIKMTFGLVSDANYVNSLGLNNLTLKIN